MAKRCGLPLLQICDHRAKACGSSRRVPEGLGAIPLSRAVLELIAPGAAHRDKGRWSLSARELRFAYGGIVNASCRLDGSDTKPWSGSVTTVRRKGPMSFQRHRRTLLPGNGRKAHTAGTTAPLVEGTASSGQWAHALWNPERIYRGCRSPRLEAREGLKGIAPRPWTVRRRQRAGSCLASSSAQRA